MVALDFGYKVYAQVIHQMIAGRGASLSYSVLPWTKLSLIILVTVAGTCMASFPKYLIITLPIVIVAVLIFFGYLFCIYRPRA